MAGPEHQNLSCLGTFPSPHAQLPLTHQCPPPVCWEKTINAAVCPFLPLLPGLLPTFQNFFLKIVFISSSSSLSASASSPFSSLGAEKQEGWDLLPASSVGEGGPLLLLELFCLFLLLLFFLQLAQQCLCFLLPHEGGNTTCYLASPHPLHALPPCPTPLLAPEKLLPPCC